MTPPIKLILSGGLGNQLFQLAAGIEIENSLNRTVLYDVSNLLGAIKSEPGNYTRKLEISELIDPKRIVFSQLPLRVQNLKFRLEKSLFSNSLLIENGPTNYLIREITEKTTKISGFFQNASLVDKTWDLLTDKLAKSNKFSRFLNPQRINRVAIHLRFGDYSDDPKTKSTYGLTQPEYYLDALHKFDKDNELECPILVVTDNLVMAKNTINKENTSAEISYVSNTSAVDDLFELTKSSHVVISNSTFSWWGAWFAFKGHGAKVIYPRPWFADNSDPELPIYVGNWLAQNRKFFV